MDLSEIRTWFLASLAVPVIARFGIVQPYWLVFIWSPIVKQFQLWRLVTPFFYNKLGFNLLMNLYFIHQHSMELETVTFAGRPADYAFFLIFCGITSLTGAVLLDLVVLSDALVLAIIHYWSLRNSERVVSFMFGMRFKAKYLAAVLMGFELLTSGGLPITSLVGAASAQAYHYLMDILPARGGRRWLTTPALLQRWLPSAGGPHRPDTTTGTGTATTSGRYSATASTGFSTGRNTTPTSTNATQRGPSSGGQAHNWGRGQRLGDG
ncbi:Der1-like family-domain-containing protein [Syncephalis fuscata]|nr:Der1-like family-domain-containing protein [Syncephalis fuscata]